MGIDVELNDATYIILTLPGTVTQWTLPHPMPQPRVECNCHWIVLTHGGISPEETWEGSSAEASSYGTMGTQRRWLVELKGAEKADLLAFYHDFQKEGADFVP